MKAHLRPLLQDAFVRWLVPFVMVGVVTWISWTIEEKTRGIAEAAVTASMSSLVNPKLQMQAEVIQANVEAMQQVAETNAKLAETLTNLRTELAELRGFVHAVHPGAMEH